MWGKPPHTQFLTAESAENAEAGKPRTPQKKCGNEWEREGFPRLGVLGVLGGEKIGGRGGPHPAAFSSEVNS